MHSARRSRTAGPREDRSIAYVLKGFPRLSEIFIASEIARLEEQGLRIRLYVIKPSDETVRHPVVDRIAAVPHHLSPTSSMSETTVPRWLVRHLRDYTPALRRIALRRPAGLARAARDAFAQAWRARNRRIAWPRRIYLREFLQGAAIADRILAAGDVRHIHAHFCHGATTVAWFAATMTGLPLSFTAHAKDIYDESLNPAGLLRRKLLAARFAVTCTEANRRHMSAVAPEARIVRVYHGLNADFTRLLNGHRPTPPNGAPLRVLAVGRMVEKKGFDVLVDALALLSHRGVPVVARIVGESGDQSAAIGRRIADNGLSDSVQVEGPKTQEGLYEEYTSADVFCLPCRIVANGDRDGIPNVLMEAMACGLPVVTTDVSGIPELVRDGDNGVLVSPESPEELADALAGLAGDRDRYRAISAAAIDTVRREFDGDRLARDVLDLFEETR